MNNQTNYDCNINVNADNTFAWKEFLLGATTSIICPLLFSISYSSKKSKDTIILRESSSTKPDGLVTNDKVVQMSASMSEIIESLGFKISPQDNLITTIINSMHPSSKKSDADILKEASVIPIKTHTPSFVQNSEVLSWLAGFFSHNSYKSTGEQNTNDIRVIVAATATAFKEANTNGDSSLAINNPAGTGLSIPGSNNDKDVIDINDASNSRSRSVYGDEIELQAIGQTKAFEAEGYSHIS